MSTKASALKMVAFRHATLATLMQAVNTYTANLDVPAATSGTVHYLPGDVGERKVIDQEYFHDGTDHVAVLWLTSS